MGGCLAQTEVLDESSPRAAPDSEGSCRVQLDDSLNGFTTFIDAVSFAHGPSLSFIIYDEGLDVEIEAEFERRNWPLETDVSVPDDTLVQIRKRYQDTGTEFFTRGVVEVDSQLTYTLLPGASCTRDEFALIEFFVNEWLYFG